MAAHAQDWRYIAAVQTGTSHGKTGAPCQDAYHCDLVTGADGMTYLVAVVSDGAGSAKHSEIGSALACRIIGDAVRDYLTSGDEWPIPRAYFLLCLEELQKALATKAAQENAIARDFACTLVATIVGSSGTVFLQIGDGAIVFASRDMPGKYAAAFWPDRGEYANQTTFITSPDAIESLRHEFIEDVVDEVAVFTDGIQNLVLDYRKQDAHSPWFDRMLAVLRKGDKAGYLPELSEKLDAFLSSKEVNDRTDDDKSLILASRRLQAEQSTKDQTKPAIAEPQPVDADSQAAQNQA